MLNERLAANRVLQTATQFDPNLDHVVEDKVSENHDRVRSDAWAAISETVINLGVPRLESVGKPERQITQRHNNIRPNLFKIRIMCVKTF